MHLQPLDLRPPVGAAARARRRAPTSGTSRSICPRGSRVEYKFEVVPRRPRRVDRGPAQPATARATRSARTRSRTATGYEVPELDRTRIPTRAPGHARASSDRLEARLRRARGFGALPAGALPRRRGATRCSSSTTAATTCATRRCSTVLDNLIHRLEIPDMIVAFTDSPDRLREYANDERHARSSPRSSCPYLERAAPARSTGRRRAASWARASARSPRSRRRGATRASAAACCCSRARSRSPTSATATAAARCSIRSSQFVNRVPRGARRRSPSGCS